MLNQDEGGKDATKQQRNSKNRIRVKKKNTAYYDEFYVTKTKVWNKNQRKINLQRQASSRLWVALHAALSKLYFVIEGIN